MADKLPKTKTFKQEIGGLGEQLAAEYLQNLGHRLVDCNYWRKWGELDLVTTKDSIIHFVEVKTVSRTVSRETADDYEPEDNVHPWKRQRLARVVQTYLLENKVGEDVDWQIDVISVYLDGNQQLIKIEVLEDIIL
jgi:putative endonuclease